MSQKREGPRWQYGNDVVPYNNREYPRAIDIPEGGFQPRLGEALPLHNIKLLGV